jgi:hypothetical protein
MQRCDDRISKADWKALIDYWRTPEFEVSHPAYYEPADCSACLAILDAI